MLQRPFYQTTIAFLTLLAFSGGVWLLASQGAPQGVEIVRPTISSSAGGALATPTAVSALPASPGTLVNINTAPASELDASLPGIGPVLAERIVTHRETNGPFQRPDQIMTVPGIGAGTFENLRSLITIGD